MKNAPDNANRVKRSPAWLALVTPALLLLVAGWQIYRANYRDLTPWKGGGFGMFASVDSRGARNVRAFVMTHNGETYPVRVPGHLAERLSKYRAEPDAITLQRLAEELATYEWYNATLYREQEHRQQLTSLGITQTAAVPSVSPTRLRAVPIDRPKYASDFRVSIKDVKLQLWTREFDSPKAEVSRKLVYEATSPVGKPDSESETE